MAVQRTRRVQVHPAPADRKNHHNSHFLFLNNIELFGTMSHGDETAATCVKQGKS
jgi:hypothetical protein